MIDAGASLRRRVDFFFRGASVSGAEPAAALVVDALARDAGEVLLFERGASVPWAESAVALVIDALARDAGIAVDLPVTANLICTS